MKKNRWKKEYLRILLSHRIEKDDWGIANELIESGYAKGVVDWGSDSKSLSLFVWHGPTTEGRLFADKLSLEIDKASITYKVKVAIFGLFNWFMGVVTALITCDMGFFSL